MTTARIRRHWTQVAALQCLVTGGPAQICHCHGPSLQERNPRFLKGKGKKQLWQDWLVVPLSPNVHFWMDNDPAAFERAHGTPASLLDQVCVLTGIDVWQMALQAMKPSVEKV